MKNGSPPSHGPRSAFNARKKRRPSRFLQAWCWRARRRKIRSSRQMANAVVFGILPTTELVETAICEMKRDGFRNIDIAVLFSQDNDAKDFGSELGVLDGI